MKMKYWMLLLMLAFACKDKYVPKLHESVTDFLVAEGFINAGNGPTVIHLSRTTRLDSVHYLSETGAQVEVRSENGLSYPLTEQEGGKYIIDQVTADPSQKYMLYIKTANGKEYLSDPSEVKTSPPIDSLSYSVGADAVNVYVSTHDPANKTLYYQWDFDETWIYSATFFSDYVFKDTFPIPRSPIYILLRTPDQIYPNTCWSYDTSTSLIIGSSVKLAADVISEFPVTSVSYFPSNKLVNRYSIHVNQYALTKEWYEWKQKVKKNTEQLGSIFDAQPSETGGNIHSTTDPEEKVIGFIGCTSKTEKRIFIDRADIQGKKVLSGYEGCSEFSILYNIDSLKPYYNYPFLITGFVVGMGGQISRVRFTGANCVDCRIMGGKSTKPDFWK